MPQKPFAVLPLALTGIATRNAKSNRPASHLALTQYPAMRWESDGNGNLWVRGQFGGATAAVDFMSLMGANAQAGTTIRLRLGTTQAQVDGTAPYDSTALPFVTPANTRADGLYHSHLEIGSVQSASWWRIDISGHTGDFIASALVLGLRRVPSNYYNRDREIGFEDLGALEISRNGVPAETGGVVLRTLVFRLQWVEEEEFWTLWAPLMAEKGKRQVVYWCFDPEATARRQDKSVLGFFTRDLFMRGNDFPKANQMDFQIRGLAFPEVPPPPPPPTPEEALAALMTGKTGAGMWNNRTATDTGTLTVANIAGTASALTQATASDKPAINATNGLVFSPPDDQVQATVETATYTIDLLMRKRAGSTTGSVLQGLIIYTDGSGTGHSGGGTVTVDGVASGNRNLLHDNLGENVWRHVRITGLSLTGLLQIGHPSSGALDGDVMLVTAIPEAQFSGSGELDAVRAASAAWIAANRPT